MFETLSNFNPTWRALSVLTMTTGFLWMMRKWMAFRSLARSYRDLPGPRFFAYSLGFLNFRYHIRGFTTPRNMNFVAKHKVYEDYGWDMFTNIFAWPKARATIWVADPEAIKEITLSRSRFPKPVAMYQLLSIYGANIVASEGEDWKRHRKISAPAFSERNNQLVWDETIRIVSEMIRSWGTIPEVSVDHAVPEITLPIALLVIGVAGFGRRVGWAEDSVKPAGHKMSFRTALSTISKDLFLKFIIPSWASGLTERYRNIHIAFDELRLYMQEMIDEREKAEAKDERWDLFSSLIDASRDESDAQYKLSDSELMGNVFIFVLAGHEESFPTVSENITTAHTLGFTFALLALYQDEQELLYQQIKSVLLDGSIPKYEQMPLLTRSMAVFYETLRLFPPVNAIPKVSAEDTTLPCHGSIPRGKDTPRRMVAIPKGARLMIHTPGLHYNPRFWEDPHAFKPERFLGDWPREAFLPFSAGPRACIGRKFFETEGIAILTMLVSQFRIEIKEEPQFAGETFEQRKERVLKCKAGLTLTPVRVPLVFKRRTP